MTKIKQIFQKQEPRSINCFFGDHGEQFFFEYISFLCDTLDKDIYPWLCLLLFWANLAYKLE